MILLLLLPVLYCSSQSVGISDDGSTPVSSAILDVKSTDKGMLIPRVELTSTTSTAPIGSGIVTSLLVYNTETANDVTPGYYYWNGSAWVRLLTGSSDTTTVVYVLDPSLTSPDNPYIAYSNGEDVIRILENIGDNYDNYNTNDEQTGGISAFIYLPNQDSPEKTTGTSNGRTALEIALSLPNTKRIQIYGNRESSYDQRLVLTFSNQGAIEFGRNLSDLYTLSNGFDGTVIIQKPIRNAITVTYGGNGLETQWQYDYPVSFFGNDQYDGWGNNPHLNSDGALARYSLTQNQWEQLTGQTNIWDPEVVRRAWDIGADPSDIAYTLGKVGIGTNSPASLLHVESDEQLGTASTTTGQLKFFNSASANATAFQAGQATSDVTYTLPTADGTSGQSLTTNGSGALSWASRWSLTGNAGTNPATDYIGTSNAQPVMFGYNGNKIGKLYQESGDTKSDFILYSPNLSKFTQIGSDQTWNVSQYYTTLTSIEFWSNANKALTLDGSQNASFMGNIIAGIEGKGLQVKEGSNARMGTATLSSGTVTVSNTSITANTRVFLTLQNCSGCGNVYLGTVTAGASFVIKSTNVSDASTVAWILAEPAP
jgi:hypothetical protein